MAKRKTSTKTTIDSSDNKPNILALLKTRQAQTIFGAFLILFSAFLCIAFISFFFNWQEDQSTLTELTDKTVRSKNLLGKIGANLSHFFIYKSFGIGAFIIAFQVFLTGTYFLLKKKLSKVVISWNWALIAMLWFSICLGFTHSNYALLSGIIGFEINEYLQAFIGKTGLVILLGFFFITYIVLRYKVTLDKNLENFKRKREERKAQELIQDETSTSTPIPNPTNEVIKTETKEVGKTISLKTDTKEKSVVELSLENLQPTISKHSDVSNKKEEITLKVEKESGPVLKTEIPQEEEKGIEVETEMEVEIDVAIGREEESSTENLSNQLVQEFGEFDPTLELGNFKFPTFNLLKQYNESISIDPEELEANKDRIVDTLKNYKIGIAEIKATVGPTITLYEIVPEAGIRISKIKNLEDDIALSLSALGIRIIAPIPGKGTIGIEVPNKKSTIVSMHSVISSKKFQESDMELPIALGKTISNETFVVDLAKMPHLLMAGATGQGKSVGLNAVLTSLLYKKHPAEVKFILVDPKKVELTLFNKIERHYLAKLPDVDEAIITDTTKVVHTLNSLCIEMDNRYDLLKNAMVRNIKEYNTKFKQRKLNPNDGHQYLPYIVLVIDEFADLIMTAGKEVETPIARLAQLARAIGIHLIVATQRPSVNVITGIIKANFPARIAFRVTSKIDSRTILDAGGADQLIGRGDLLYTAGNNLNRIQCAFVDTPEVEKITDFIGSQKAYAEAYLLPEYVDDESGTSIDIDISDRDKLFRDACEIIVTAQQGSASLLQRKLKLGYNRAGRLIDQLEAAGIVGGFEGSKARQVLVPDFVALDQLLENEKINNLSTKIEVITNKIMRKITILFLTLFITTITFSQNSEKAKSLLDEVSTKMGAYENMSINFSQTLSNEDAGILEGDEPPIRGQISLQGEKYSLNYLGNKFIFDGKKLYVINNDEKEITITDGDMSGDDGFIYPSKLLTFYKEGYNFEMGDLKNLKGRKIQFVTLNPIDSESDIVKVELAIDAKTLHIYKLIQTGSNGSKTTFTITEFKSDQALSSNYFSFDEEKYKKLEFTID